LADLYRLDLAAVRFFVAAGLRLAAAFGLAAAFDFAAGFAFAAARDFEAAAVFFLAAGLRRLVPRINGKRPPISGESSR
jgi:hypothetical protein